jgi:hypothetical protein
MNEPKPMTKEIRLGGILIDAMVDDTAYEVLADLRDVRRLRASLMELARVAVGTDVRRVILVLDEPLITRGRLKEEWDSSLSVLRPDVSSRMSLAARMSEEWWGIPKSPQCETVEELERILRQTEGKEGFARRTNTYFDILRLLIHQWLQNPGPVPVNWIVENSGTSYPTVSRALSRFERYLVRHSDRSVELKSFPRDEWARLVAVADDVRGTVRFADRSGQPRSPESQLKRLERTRLKEIGIGGAIGARYYYPELDLIGEHRLDLSLHVRKGRPDLSFVEKLDPGLKREIDPSIPASVVIHLVRNANSFFVKRQEGLSWADPVECLLDLHEARLETQAKEFLNGLTRKRKSHV